MEVRRKRWFIFAFCAALIVGYVHQCVPEKSVDPATKVTPVGWLNSDTLLLEVKTERYAQDLRTGRREPATEISAEWVKQYPLFSFEPANPDVIVTKESYLTVSVDGDTVRLNSSRPYRQMGYNQEFPEMKRVPFKSYLHFGKVGLVTFELDDPSLFELPLLNRSNRSAPLVVWDEHTGQFFAFQKDCGSKEEKGKCYRTGWWLDRNLQVVHTVLLPEKDILFVEETLACFSCGCSCYTQEDVYAVNGRVYFHISGFPLPTSQRGLYQVSSKENGSSEWLQIIEGRIEPPLAFSPSGCEVAFYRISYLGDKLETARIC